MEWIGWFYTSSSNGVYSQVVLTQSEQSVTVSSGGSYKLTCACSGFTLSGYRMDWIRQASGKGLEWILHYYTDSDKGSAQSVQGRFMASKDSSNFYLHMSQLRTEDTAVYYCARDSLYDGLIYWGLINTTFILGGGEKQARIFTFSVLQKKHDS
uniref:Ig-like domain-containing protein n=1 Tax=Cyprinus carpio TaxID=7962 RepID=A0A8C1WU46_CYPCA